MKLSSVVLLILVLLSYNGLSQDIKDINIFSSLSGYRNVGYENNLFTKVDLGLGFFSKSRFSPEISASFSSGSPQDQLNIFTLTEVEIEEQTKTQFSSALFSLGVVTRITSREDFWIFVDTKYHVGIATVRSRLFRGEVATAIPFVEELENKESVSFFDFSLGMESYIDEAEHWTASISLVYTTFEISQVVGDLNFQESELNINSPSRGGVGLKFLLRYHL